jgi:hypothetical protein
MADLPETRWQKSSLCNTNSCVEVAFLGSYVAMRDAKDQAKTPLYFTEAEWSAFIDGARNGEFNFALRPAETG